MNKIPIIILVSTLVIITLLFSISFNQSIETTDTSMDTEISSSYTQDPQPLDPLEAPFTIPSADAQAANSAILSKVNNRLAIELYQNLEQDSSQNIFFSPTSVMTAMALVYEGAAGNTATQMEDALDFSSDANVRRHGFNTIISSLNSDNPEYDIALANAAWLPNEFQPKTEYKEIITTYYDSIIEPLSDPQSGADMINKWASDKTNGIFEEIITEEDLKDPHLRMILTNAIYFKGKWVEEFNENHTQQASFWTSSQDEIKADTMNLLETSFRYTSTDDAQVLEMPYKGDRFSMIVILPHERDGLQDVEDSLTYDSIEMWRDDMQLTFLNVHMPKFKIGTDYDLVPSLKELGIEDAFSTFSADFTKISDIKPPLYISAITQVAFVDVNEEGTKAAAITIVTIMNDSTKIIHSTTFRADHPFLFAIWDDETNSILFMGRIVNPTI